MAALLLVGADQTATTKQPVFRIADPKPAGAVPAPFSCTARVFWTSNKTEIIIAVRKLFTRYSYEAGNLPWTYTLTNESYILPDEEELRSWYSHQLVRIGAQGDFYGSEATKYYEQPFADERWVTSSVLNRNRNGIHLFYHNLHISWTAYMHRMQVHPHLQMKDPWTAVASFNIANQIFLRNISDFSYFRYPDKAILIPKAPKIEQTTAVLDCTESSKSGALACKDHRTGVFLEFSREERLRQPVSLVRCVGEFCYSVNSRDKYDRTPTSTRNTVRLQPVPAAGPPPAAYPGAAAAPPSAYPAAPAPPRPDMPAGPVQPPVVLPHLPGLLPPFISFTGLLPAAADQRPPGAWTRDPKTASGSPNTGYQIIATKEPMDPVRPGQVELIDDGAQKDAGPQEFRRVEVPVTSQPSAEDFNLLSANIEEVRHDGYHRDMVQDERVYKLERIIKEIAVEMARQNQYFLYKIAPKGTAPFKTIAVGPNTFITIPAEEEAEVNSNCNKDQIFKHGQWIRRPVDSKDECITWANINEIDLFSHEPLEEADIVEGSHVPSPSDDAQAWQFFVSHAKEIEEMENICEMGGVEGTGLIDVLKMGPGVILGLFHYLCASSLFSFIWFLCGFKFIFDFIKGLCCRRGPSYVRPVATDLSNIINRAERRDRQTFPSDTEALRR